MIAAGSSSTWPERKDVEAEVRCNNKQRFQLWTENGARRIRANQGHKMKQAPGVQGEW